MAGNPRYHVYLGPGHLQLYPGAPGQVNDTFIKMWRSQGKFIASIALQKFDAQLRREIGRIYRTPVQAAEIHVISNLDVNGGDELDLTMDCVPLERILPRIQDDAADVPRPGFRSVDWTEHPIGWQKILQGPEDVAIPSCIGPKQATELLLFAFSHRATSKCMNVARKFYEIHKDRALARLAPLMKQTIPILALCFLRPLHEPDTADLAPFATDILSSLVVAADEVGPFAAAAFWAQNARWFRNLSDKDIIQLIWLICLTVHSREIRNELIFSIDELYSKTGRPLSQYAVQQSVGVSLDFASEIHEACKFSNRGIPTSRPLPQPILISGLGDLEPGDWSFRANWRVDFLFTPKSGDLFVLKSNTPGCETEDGLPMIITCTLTSSSRGEGKFRSLKPLPPGPFVQRTTWLACPASSIATAQAEIDALVKICESGSEATLLLPSIVFGEGGDYGLKSLPPPPYDHTLNESQNASLSSVSTHPLSLIWGPPGTGKTTVVVKILAYLLDALPDTRVLLTASTNNAVDNVLERFLKLNIIDEKYVVRAATDWSKVIPTLRHLTVTTAYCQDLLADEREAAKQKLKTMKTARVVFATCAGAGLGEMRKQEFGAVVIDEASQVVEPVALVPLVKGAERAVLVGDHVQLRPTVQQDSEAVGFERSLFERLYESDSLTGIARTMLDTQYRFNSILASFPSRKFYQGKLRTGIDDANRQIPVSRFPWPRLDVREAVCPSIFIQCDAPESQGSRSKSNKGQADLCARIVQLLHQAPGSGPASSVTGPTPAPSAHPSSQPSIVLLTPYRKQLEFLEHIAGCEKKTIDGVQGREFDFVIYTTVRSNPIAEIGFLDDPRRLNVALTRARLGRIIVGDKRTLVAASPLWREALADCQEVQVPWT